MKLNVSVDSSRGLVDSCVFVMYNCARLATLFQHFNEAVSKGFHVSCICLFHCLSVDETELYVPVSLPVG